jgi:hypothetical protein
MVTLSLHFEWHSGCKRSQALQQYLLVVYDIEE